VALDDAAREILDRAVAERRALAHLYLPGERVFPAGMADGPRVMSEYGAEFLDFGRGGSVNILGHRNPRVIQVFTDHLRHYTYTGDDHVCRYPVEYAQALSARFPEADGEPRQVLVVSSVNDARVVARTIAKTLFNIIDETETGFGRTGTLWSRTPGRDDVVVLGPAGGGGMPFAAVVATREMFDGNDIPSMANHPVVCAAALAVLEQITDELLDHVTKMGQVLTTGITELAQQFPAVLGIPNGAGLLQQLTLNDKVQTQKFRESCRAKGLLLHPDLRMTPPLVVSEQEVRQAVDILADVCLDWS